ncbi:hypothetical protein ACO0R3_002450 [Hanseniaspora guilliermondii]
MVYSDNNPCPSFLKNGPLYPTEFQVHEKLPIIESSLPIDKSTKVLAIPVYDHKDISCSLLNLMFKKFNKEIKNGQTYPQFEPFNSVEDYTNYWFHSFCCILINKPQNIDESNIYEYIKSDELNIDWEENFLGSFYIKPNYAGRCSHICNAGFFVPENHRGKKIGYRLGQIYLKYAPKLGYSQSVYNLVYANNIGSWKIWEKLKFTRIGVVPKAAILGVSQPAIKTANANKYEYQFTDAYIYSKDLLSIEEELFEDM